jgi:hypothetical protein
VTSMIRGTESVDMAVSVSTVTLPTESERNTRKASHVTCGVTADHKPCSVPARRVVSKTEVVGSKAQTLNQHAHGTFLNSATRSQLLTAYFQLSQEEEADEGKEVTWGT